MNPSGRRFPSSENKRSGLAKMVADDISQRIRHAALAPGVRLPSEAALMTEYDVSRSAIREAISRLQAGGLVQTRHGVGSFVVAPTHTSLSIDTSDIATVSDVIAILEVRISLETEAAGLAASRRTAQQLVDMGRALTDMRIALSDGSASTAADMRFHRLIAEATDNSYIADVLARIGQALIPRARLNTPGLGTEDPADYMERMSREHDDIFRAIDRQEPEAARAAMRLHLSNSRERLKRAQQIRETSIS